MPFADELADLLHRDLTRLIQQIHAFTDPITLWRCAPGITNSAGNLALHLEGNLREYVGRIVGGIPYQRVRDQEFSRKNLTAGDLTRRLEETRQVVTASLRQMDEDQLPHTFPGDPSGVPTSTRPYLIHLYGHFSYHLGQIDYLRRLLTEGKAVDYVKQ